jgi:hypothetical protein
VNWLASVCPGTGSSAQHAQHSNIQVFREYCPVPHAASKRTISGRKAARKHTVRKISALRAVTLTPVLLCEQCSKDALALNGLRNSPKYSHRGSNFRLIPLGLALHGLFGTELTSAGSARLSGQRQVLRASMPPFRCM